MVQIVLVTPEIPANTGNIARTCAATLTPLHLVEPLGFRLSDRYMKRAGLDYWNAVDLHRHPSWEAFVKSHLMGSSSHQQVWCFSVRGTEVYTQIQYQPQDWLIFGSETQGLPPEILSEYPSARIPLSGPVRGLNLSNAVAVALFEALRQLQLRSPIVFSSDQEPT